MFRNYFKTAWRNFQNNKILSLINLGGLCIGITAVLLIGLYIYSETSYDSFHQNKASLYRVGFHSWENGKSLGNGVDFTAPFGPDAKTAFPEVKEFTRISTERISYITYGEKTMKVDDIHHADSTFFQLFSYKLLQGNPLTALQQPYSIVLTSQTAARLFGNTENAMGKLVRLDNKTDYIVTGIAQPAPSNSQLTFNALISFVTLYREPGNFMDWNGGNQYITYIQLQDGADKEALQKKLPAFMWEHINKLYAEVGARIDAFLQPLTGVHLNYSDNASSLRTNIYVFSIVALFILIISCVNYINLTTARAITRFKEIGVRKVLGAGRGQLIKQFLIETAGVTIAAFAISLVLVTLLIPAYQRIIGQQLPALNVNTLPALLLLFLLVMVVGIIAGSYVAFYLSSFNITGIFRSLLPKSTQSTFRKGLIVTQFTITIALSACTIIVSRQLRYSKTINTGFDKENVMVLPLIGDNTKNARPFLQQKLLQLSSVQQVSGLSEIPYDGITSNGFVPEGLSTSMIIHQLDADGQFLETFNIRMVSGDYFSKDRAALSDGYIINETLAKTLGWQNPIGKTISRNGEHKVVGVIKDFHFASLHDKIEPLIITNKPWGNRYSYLAIKYRANNVPAFINDVKQTWESHLPGAPFDYWFLDEAFNTVYKGEQRFRQVFIYFSALSILLSLAGVFGLVALAIKQRAKEFGIRKVLGAGIIDIIRLTVAAYIWPVALATVIAAPVAWYYMNKWLQSFAYRISISWLVFAGAGLLVLGIVLITISFQSIKAALTNPVKSLRAE